MKSYFRYNIFNVSFDTIPIAPEIALSNAYKADRWGVGSRQSYMLNNRPFHLNVIHAVSAINQLLDL